LGALVLPGGAIALLGGDDFESVLMASGRSPAMLGNWYSAEGLGLWLWSQTFSGVGVLAAVENFKNTSCRRLSEAA
jgi:hypothetical protein